ncbi:hypothetical protein [Hansschlegelia sp.]|uniref:hypothetical protein n=1 Tax=Hansschlegelia sp. TaxID=2041892 RepID=UPI002B83A2C6|nr:hypothetical protein [Hansschlegelia sp.]HVI28722.1 hypothetical protein [Hansschlegelia sp.]
MPYNVIADREGRSEIIFCESAGEASFRLKLLASKGVGRARAMSTEGIDVPLDRLEKIARCEMADAGLACRTPASDRFSSAA